MKRYAIVRKDAETEREIERFECEDAALWTIGGIRPWAIFVAICVWLLAVIEMIVRAVVGVFI